MRILLPVTCKLEEVTVSIVTTPVKPLTLLTPPEPGQLAKLNEPPEPETKHWPAVLVLTVATALVPCPTNIPFVARLARPVPPLATPRA